VTALSPSKLKGLAPDGMLAGVLLAFLATAGLFYVNIMPALVSGLQDGLGFSARDAGFVASANVYGAAVGALVSVPVVGRIAWRRAAVAALLVLVALDLVSTQLHLAPALIALRFVHGLVGGFLVGVGFSVIARSGAPDRNFGLLLVVQFGLGGIGLMFLPGLARAHGAPVLFLALAAFSLATLAMLPALPAYPDVKPAPLLRSSGAHRARLWLTLAAILLFQVANMGLSAFIIGLGRQAGLSDAFVSGALGASNWIGAGGSVLVAALGVRFGRAGPLLAGGVVSAIGGALFYASDWPAAFAAANLVSAIAWAFVIPYLLGLASAFEPGGRAAALAGFFSKMGLATGPAVAGVLLQETHYGRLIALAVVGVVLSAVFAVAPALALDRTRTADLPKDS